MADLGTAYVQIVPSAEGISGSISEVLQPEAENAGTKGGDAVGNKLLTALKGVLTVAAVKTAISSVTSAVTSVAEYGDEIDKTAQKVGLSNAAYQKWDYVMQLAGTSMSDCVTGVKTLTNQIDEAKNGSETAQEAFGKLGLSVDDLNNMSREDAMAAVISGLQGMEDSTERAALANDLFGKSGQNLTPLFNQSAEDTQALMEQYEELGNVMSDDMVADSAEFEDAQTTLQSTLNGVKNDIVSGMLPTLTDLMNGFTDVASGVDLSPLGDDFSTLGDAISDAVENIDWEAVTEDINDFVAKIGEVKDGLTAVGDWITEHQTLLEVLGILIAGIATAIVAYTVAANLGTIAMGLMSGAMTLYTTVTTIATAAGTAFGAVMAFITSPITLVILAIAALIAIGVLLYKNWDTISEKVSEVVDNVKTKFTDMKDKVTEVFTNVKATIKEKIDDAKQAVKDAIDKIKGFFNFSWSLPALKLPHITASGSFSLHPLSVPSFSISWYAKAMDQAMLLDGATIFGASGGNLLGGGETGREVVVGENYLMDSIGEAMDSRLSRVESLLETYLPGMAENKQIVLDSGVLVGATARQMDTALGKLSTRASRGVYA